MQIDKKYMIRLTIAFIVMSVALGGLVAVGDMLPIIVVGAVWIFTAFNVIKYSRAYTRQLQEVPVS